MTAIYRFSSLEEMWDVHAKIRGDEAFAKAEHILESGPEPAFEARDSSLVEAADFSPEIKLEAGATPRIFELRVYYSPTYRQLAALNERFRGPEIKIFHRVGIHPILYGSTVIGADVPNLTYLIPFADLATREKAWNAFGADPEWQRSARSPSTRTAKSSARATSLFIKQPHPRPCASMAANARHGIIWVSL